MFIVPTSFDASGTHTFKHVDISLIIYVQAKVAKTVKYIAPKHTFSWLMSALGNECPCYSQVHTQIFALWTAETILHIFLTSKSQGDL